MLFDIHRSAEWIRLAQGTDCQGRQALPLTLAPRLISREAAAAYICVSPNAFDEMVRSGQMPRAGLLGERRRAWDVRQVDIAIDELPSDGNNTRVPQTHGSGLGNPVRLVSVKLDDCVFSYPHATRSA